MLYNPIQNFPRTDVRLASLWFHDSSFLPFLNTGTLALLQSSGSSPILILLIPLPVLLAPKASWATPDVPQGQPNRVLVQVTPKGEAVAATAKEQHLLFVWQENAAVVVQHQWPLNRCLPEVRQSKREHQDINC